MVLLDSEQQDSPESLLPEMTRASQRKVRQSSKSAPSGAKRSQGQKRQRVASSGGDDGENEDQEPSFPQLSQNTPTQDDHDQPSYQCQKCKINIAFATDRFVVTPCAHTLCNLCAVDSQIKRGCKPHTCPVADCNCYSTGVEYYRGGGKDSELVLIHNPVIGHKDYIEENLPVVWLKQQHRSEIEESFDNEGIVITCTKIQKKKNSFALNRTTITSTFVLHHRGDDMPIEVLQHERALEEVGRVFAFMHGAIVQPSNSRVRDLPVLSPREFLDMLCQQPRLLDRALFAFATGNAIFDKFDYLQPNQQDHQKQYLAAVMSSDILLRVIRKHPGYFQLMMGELLEYQKVTREFRDLCSAAGIAPSRSYSLKERATKALNQMRQGLDVKARDLVLLFFDNVGFKVLGRQASYDQWIVINSIVVPEKVLKKAGFYQDDSPNDQRISREPDHDWEELRATYAKEHANAFDLAHLIVGIKDEDYQLLTECVAENILVALEYLTELSIDNKHISVRLPRFERIVSMETRIKMDKLLKNNHPMQGSVDAVAVSSNHRSAVIPRNSIPPDKVSGEIGGDDILRTVDGAGVVITELEQEGANNQYSKNHATMEVKHEDLSQKATVLGILWYIIRSNKSQLQKWKEIKHLFNDMAEPPLAEIMIGCGCDGQPAEALRKILEEDATKGSDRLFPESVFVSFGGFHTVLKSLNASGEYFEELLKNLWSSFRDSLEKVKWILFPSDPRQRESDYTWCLLAHYVVAARSLGRHLGRNVSVVEVINFMSQRAREYPICALALCEIRIGTVIKLLRNSEKLGPRGSVPTFLAAIRLIMPLFAVTHKTNYMSLCQELLKWYYCASPAQKKIYKEFIFTQLTTTDIPIFHDIFVENSVRHIRGFAGKVHGRGMDIAMETIAAKIPTTDGEKAAARNLHKMSTETSSTRSRMHDTLTTDSACPFYKISSEYEKMQLWAYGEAPVVEGRTKGKFIKCKDNILIVPGGGLLDSIILSAITELGRKRTYEHFIRYYIEKNNDGTRSDKIVNLSKICTTVTSISEKLSIDLTFATSTTAKDFNNRVFTRAKLMELIKDMVSVEKNKSETERVHITEASPKKDATKDSIVAFLVRWREEVFKKNPTMKEERIEQISASYNRQSLSLVETRSALLEDKFFNLSQSVLQNNRYTEAVESPLCK